MALSGDDREWLEQKFTRIHDRIDAMEERDRKRGSDIHKIETELVRLAAGQCEDIEKHVEKYHNPGKTIGTLAAVMGVITGLWEGFKWFVKRGGE